jgi:hypothetical protein
VVGAFHTDRICMDSNLKRRCKLRTCIGAMTEGLSCLPRGKCTGLGHETRAIINRVINEYGGMGRLVHMRDR